MKKNMLILFFMLLCACNEDNTNQNITSPKSRENNIKTNNKNLNQQPNEIKIIDPFVDDRENINQNNNNVLFKDSIKNMEIVGYITDKQQDLALLKMPDNNIVTVSKDMIIGVEHARIISITNNEILLELEKNFRGIKEYKQEKIKM